MYVLLGGSLFLIGLLVLQTAIVSRLPLLYGSADLFVLFLSAWALQGKAKKSLEFALLAGLLVGAVSALPFYIYFATYIGIVIIANFLKNRVWQTPLLALAFTIIVSTLVEHGLTILWMRLSGVPLSINQALGLVSVPTILINLLLSIPIYAIINDIVGTLYPSEGEA